MVPIYFDEADVVLAFLKIGFDILLSVFQTEVYTISECLLGCK